MNLLLDTHAFIWWDRDPERLPPRVYSACENQDNRLYLSIASVWEMQIKVALGKLSFQQPLQEIIERQKNENGVSILPVSLAHVWQLGTLPAHHNDPFDRMLVAQAAADKLALVTADRHIARYSVELFW
ncbi:MAG: type II toxin-antitoxin system VapC family toxin [Sulfuricella sp.]|jgi:PIN domain nuclease of toxin-antitoxin system|nr:type II toxin-antitoxin system VapC family toxin [Sulfuricella sp.]